MLEWCSTARVTRFVAGLEVVDPRWSDKVKGRFEATDVLGVDVQAEVLLGRDLFAA